MKKIIVLSLVASALLISVESLGQFRLGIKAGYNSSTLGGLSDYSTVKDVAALPGFHAGLFGQLKITILTLQLETIYSTQGTKATLLIDDTEYKYENNYLNVPVVAMINLGPIYVLGGLQYGLLLNSTINGVDVDDLELYTKSDLSVPVGVGVNISKLILEARYNIGVTNVNNLSNDDVLTNAVLQLSAGWKFGKK